ncbi:hypothetical protein DERP_007598 [Dermatophagoides pteronyssinus]|uniref:Uncharacterized protein n=1 Tax=Dermatophagoides pteronyssinus TaxID=6956 RepID=A0ABQ8JK75_DERPT|nr:hypothetical protein DERP_007598 [Dermatophagoides pteronyssinus]
MKTKTLNDNHNNNNNENSEKENRKKNRILSNLIKSNCYEKKAQMNSTHQDLNIQQNYICVWDILKAQSFRTAFCPPEPPTMDDVDNGSGCTVGLAAIIVFDDDEDGGAVGVMLTAF